MANVCYNWIEVSGDEASIKKLRKQLVADNEADIRDIDDPKQLVFSIESRWVAPLEWLEEISQEYKVLVECESEESGCDYWCKVAYKDGENVFGVQLNYLEGKYRSLDWNEFIECEVMWRLEDSDPFDEFIKQFDFCNEEEIAELEELFFEHSNED
jgi:hypothetical protein